MGTRQNRLTEAVLGAVITCTRNQCLEQKKRKNIIIFHLKMNIFTAVKYCCILHGRVFVMCLWFLVISQFYFEGGIVVLIVQVSFTV